MSETTPTLVGFTAYCRNVAGITDAVMPDADPGFQIALDVGLAWIPCVLKQISGAIYTYTVYQWGVSWLLQWQNDQTGQDFFTTMRARYGVNNLVAGVISATADESTSDSLTVGRALSDLDLVSLQEIKNPFGRAAVATLMSLGPVWGLS